MKDIYNELNGYFDVMLVNDLEYYDKLIEGLVILTDNGEIQVFKDIDNKESNNNSYIILDSNFNIALKTTLKHKVCDYFFTMDLF